MNQKLVNAQKEVQQSQRELSQALDHLKDKVDDASKRAEILVDKARDKVEQLTNKVTSPIIFIEKRPLAVVVGSFLGGFIVGLLYKKNETP